jgi:hypothetical protein
MPKRVALVWRGEPGEPFESSGLPPIGRALQARGLDVMDVPFTEEVAGDVRSQLAAADAALVWVDPISTVNGRNRALLDSILREVAARGVWVSAHPNAILKLGTKEVLVKTKEMGWGSDCDLYQSEQELAADLPGRLRRGATVLKRHRGNGGDGVWKVELIDSGGEDVVVRALHARRGSFPEELRLLDFVARCAPYFDGNGCMIGQPFQDRLSDGQIRCYIVNNKVSGFGHHYVAGLLARRPGEAPVRNPRLYYGPSYPEFKALKDKLEGGWIDEMVATLEMETDELPALWDADFFYGPKDAFGEDTYVLCEINASSVDIFPGETLTALADAVADRLAHFRTG